MENSNTKKANAEIKRLRNEREALSERIDNARQNLRNNLLYLALAYVFCWSIAIYYWDKPVLKPEHVGGKETAALIGIGLFIWIPIYYLKQKRELRRLEAEKSSAESLLRQLED